MSGSLESRAMVLNMHGCHVTSYVVVGVMSLDHACSASSLPAAMFGAQASAFPVALANQPNPDQNKTHFGSVENES